MLRCTFHALLICFSCRALNAKIMKNRGSRRGSIKTFPVCIIGKLSTNQCKEMLTLIKISIWLVIGGLLTNDKVVIGPRVARGSQQLQCPQVPASFGEDRLNLSSFSVFINQSDGVRDDGNSSDDGQCKFIVT